MIDSSTYITINEGAGERDDRPEEDATGHDELSVVAVAEVAEHRRQKHVAEDEWCLE